MGKTMAVSRRVNVFLWSSKGDGMVPHLHAGIPKSSSIYCCRSTRHRAPAAYCLANDVPHTSGSLNL